VDGLLRPVQEMDIRNDGLLGRELQDGSRMTRVPIISVPCVLLIETKRIRNWGNITSSVYINVSCDSSWL